MPAIFHSENFMKLWQTTDIFGQALSDLLRVEMTS